MTGSPILTQLAHQLEALAQLLAPLEEYQSVRPRFDRQLFTSQSTRIADYLAEAQHNFQRLQQACATDDSVKAAWLAEKLVNQIAALRRESATWGLRGADTAHLRNGRLHADILRHQEYERRLQAMVASREALLAAETTLAGQQQRSREVEQYQQRLARCRAALDALNRRLALTTR